MSTQKITLLETLVDAGSGGRSGAVGSKPPWHALGDVRVPAGMEAEWRGLLPYS